MNLAETVEINKQIIELIFKKAETRDVHSLPTFDRTYITRLKLDNEKAEDWLTQKATK